MRKSKADIRGTFRYCPKAGNNRICATLALGPVAVGVSGVVHAAPTSTMTARGPITESAPPWADLSEIHPTNLVYATRRVLSVWTGSPWWESRSRGRDGVDQDDAEEFGREIRVG